MKDPENRDERKAQKEPRGRSYAQLRATGFRIEDYPNRLEANPKSRTVMLVEKMWDRKFPALQCCFWDLDDGTQFRASAYHRKGYRLGGSEIDASELRRGSVLRLKLGVTKSGYTSIKDATFSPAPSGIRLEQVSSPEAAEILGISPRTLEKWRVQGYGPPFLKLGRRVVYRRSDLESWMERQLRRSTS